MAGDYDLVILDLVMPDMDGREILARLRRERPDQAVLVLSCLADVTTKVDCLELGAMDYLTKPFSLAELLARVRVRLRDDAHPLNEVLRAGELVLVRIKDRVLEHLLSFKDFPQLSDGFASWIVLTPDDAPLLMRDRSVQEIYALDLRFH